MAEFTFELDLPPGLNSDDTSFAATGRWADGSNVRFPGGRPEALGRIVRILDGLTGGADANARTMFAFTAGASATPWVVVGSTEALFSGSGSQLNDITPAALSACDYWAFNSWGDLLLAAPKGGKLYQWDPAVGGAATEVTGPPAAMNHMLVSQQRQVLALGCNEEASGIFNPMCIRGSDIEDLSEWTTSSANNAFEHVLPGEGRIVAARLIGPYIAIWTNASLYLGQYVGEPGQAFRFDLVGGGGLVGPGAVQVHGGFAWWMTPGHHFLRWAPGGPVEPIPCPIGRELRANIIMANRSDQRTIVVSNSLYGEIWWFYPDGREEAGAYRYVALQTRDGAWFRGRLDRRAAYEADFLTVPGTSFQIYRSWRPFLGVDGEGKIWSHDVEDAGGGSRAEIAWTLQSADQYLESGRRRVMIRTFVPDFEEQEGDVRLTLILREWPQALAVEKNYTLAGGLRKKNIRASGMIASIRFSAMSNSLNQWRMGKPLLEGVTLGGR